MSFLVSALTLFAAAGGELYEGSGVKTLTSSNFDRYVDNADELALVHFYDAESKDCTALVPEFIKTAKILKGMVGVFALDGPENKGIISMYKIHDYPAIQLFNGKKAIPYTGDFSVDKLTSFAMKYVTSAVKTLTSKNYQKWVKKKSKVRVMLFTKKAEGSEFFNALSVKFFGHIAFGLVRSNKKIARKFKVDYTERNVVLIFEKGSIEPIWYMGGMRARPFKKFLMKYTPDIKPDVEDFLPKILDESCMQLTCKKKGLCVLLITTHDEDENERVHDSLMEAQDHMHSSSFFSWVQINGVENREWCEILFGKDINWDLPQVVVFSTVKKYWARYFGSYSHTALSSFVAGVLSGSTRTSGISAEEIPLLSTETEHCKPSDYEKKSGNEKSSRDKGRGDGVPGEGSKFLVTLTNENFQRRVVENPQPSIIKFYSPSCEKSKNLAPHYAKAADRLKSMVNFGVVNCSEEKDFCKRNQITSTPTLKVFEIGAKTPVLYKGQQTAKDISKYAKNLLNGAKVKRVKDKHMKQLLDSSTGMKVILFSEKDDTPTLLRGLAAKFPSCTFYIASGNNRKLMKHFDVSKNDLPKIFMLTPVSGDKHFSYSGGNDFVNMASWIEKVSVGGDKVTEHDEL